MRKGYDAIRTYAAPPLAVVLAAGLAACTSSSTSSAEGTACTSPPAVSRPMAYPRANPGERSTWGHVIVHVQLLAGGYSDYRFGYTDPGGAEHLSSKVAPTTLARYPDIIHGSLNPASVRAALKIGHDATTLTVYGIGTGGAGNCTIPPTVQFGVNGNQDQAGPVKIDAPPMPPVHPKPGVAAYQPYFP